MIQDNSPIFEFRGPFGVPVQVGASIFLLLALFLSLGSPVWAMTTAGMLIVSILLHELGHAWGALVQGVPVRRVMLHGGGGFCERARSASQREQELIVAMGPLVNLALWALAGLAAQALWWWIAADLERAATTEGLALGFRMELADQLALFSRINGFLFLFNMIPVQPLDGGKLLHLVLLRMAAPRAALRASGLIGLVLAILWVPWFVYLYWVGGWFLLFIPSIPLHYRMLKGQLT